VRISGYGIAIDLPAGWEGVIYRREPQGRPILHAGDFGLPPNDGDFGLSSVSAMKPHGVFLVLAEYNPEVAGQGLFVHQGRPWPLQPEDPSPRTMQRPRPGRAGLQRFFTARGRPFCLYLVIGTAGGTAEPIKRANAVLATVIIEPPA
jgi:hypothetical protein